MNFDKESENETQHEKQTWDNPKDPEGASDKRDLEQLERQKTEAERRKDNLSEESKQELKDSNSKVNIKT